MIVDSVLYATFVVASIGLIIMPGPNVLLIASTAISGGTWRGLQTVAGTSLAMVLQLSLVLLGMGAVVSTAGELFAWLRWLGVAYLTYLGVAHWLRSTGAERDVEPSVSGPHAFWRGFGVSLTNPKTLVFFAAFLPQFVLASSPALPQMLVLAATFVAIAVILDGCYALAAGRISTGLAHARSGRTRDRIIGTLLLATGAGLALARGE